MPPYGVFLAVTFLDEAFQPYHEAGIALVMGGVILATFPVTWLRERFFARSQPRRPSAGNVSSSQ